MAEHPEQREVGEDLAVHHRLEVELDVRLAGQGGVVAEDPQPAAVGQEGPEVVVRAVQELLDQPVRAGRLPAPAVEVDAESDQVDRGLLPGVRDRVGLVLDRHWLRRDEPAVAEFLEQRQEPALAGDGRGGVGLGELAERLAEVPPLGREPVPGVVDDFLEPLAGEVVRLGRQAVEVTSARAMRCSRSAGRIAPSVRTVVNGFCRLVCIGRALGLQSLGR